MGTSFSTSMVIKVIKKLEHRKVAYHIGLQAKHLIYAQDDLAPHINLSEGFPLQWRMNTQKMELDGKTHKATMVLIC